MTATEIRKLVQEEKISQTVIRHKAPLRDQLLAEIAAQLAELNEKLATVITQDGEGGAQYVRTALYTHTPVRKK